MKLLTLFSIFLSLCLISAAQKPVDFPMDKLRKNQADFLNLPKEKQMDFIKHVQEAERLFNQKRIFESMNELSQASTIFDDSPEIYNIRGSCLMELRDFEKALVNFNKAIAFSENNPSINFNIGEAYFVTKDWKKAIQQFENTLRLLPPNDMNLGRLIEFKILLCKNKLGMKDDVTILANKYDYLDDSPYYYYAKAMLAFENNQEKEAQEWIASAAKVFGNSNILEAWQDTIIEYGYIKSFYGGDLEINP